MHKIKNKTRNRWLMKHLPMLLACAGVISYGSMVSAENVKPELSSQNKVTVNDNSSEINGTTNVESESIDIVYGGGDEENEGLASNNRVDVNGGELGGVIGGISSAGVVSGNRVIINGGNITGGVSGGITFFSYDGKTVAGDVLRNEVIINGGTINYVSGGEIGYAYPRDESETPNNSLSHFRQGGNVSENRVEINGSRKSTVITGGVTGGAALTGKANNNTIDINGGTISGQVVGGLVRYPIDGYSSASGNTINISGSPDLSGALLRGGVLGDKDTASNNSLNFNLSENHRSTKIEAQNISGFKNLNFYLPNAEGVALSLSNSSATSLNGMNINADMVWNGGNNAGKTITLINNNNGGITTNSRTNLRNYVMEGVTLRYPVVKSESGLSSGSRSYTAKLGSPVVNPRTRSTTMAPQITSMIINHMMPHLPDPDPDKWDYETVDDPGFDIPDGPNAENKEEKPVAMAVSPFFDVNYGSMREKTGYGSYVDIDSLNMNAGVAFGRDNKFGRLVFAPIIDYGHGNYDTYLSDGTKGDGSAEFWAGGLIARQTNNSGFYYEGSIRVGRTDVDFASSDLVDNAAAGRTTFNSSASILAGHLRLGKLFNFGPKNALHVYGLYTHTHQGGMDADLSSGERYRFDSVDNGRFRLGARLTNRARRNQRFYSGLAYQYSLNDDSSAICNGIAIPKSGKNGGSGMLELGWQIKPSASAPWLLDLNATGWVGLQKGISCQARIKKDF